jgi:tetratricopeptide (TPR) repeat protein
MDAPDLQSRIATCRRRWQQAPLSRAFAPLADLLRQDGQLDEALAVLDEGLSRHPDFTGGLIVLGRTLLEAERDEKAGRVLDRVLQLDPDNVVARGLLAAEAAQCGDWATAAGHLKQLIRLEPDENRWRDELQTAEARLEPPAPPAPPAETPEERRPVAADVPSFATLTMVDIYLAQGYRGRAVNALEQILAREPHREDVRQRLVDLKAALALDPEPDAGPGDPAAPTGRRREADREQFAAWIERLREAPGGEAH